MALDSWNKAWELFGFTDVAYRRGADITDGDEDSASYIYGWYMFMCDVFTKKEAWNLTDPERYPETVRDCTLKRMGYLDAEAHFTDETNL